MGPRPRYLDALDGAGLGTHPDLLLGSVSTHVAQHAPCSAVVIPAAAGRRARGRARDQQLQGSCLQTGQPAA